MTDTEPNDFRSAMLETMNLASKVKAALLRKGKRHGWTKCPRCGGKVHASLAGHKNHLHMACETPNCMRMME
jgi:hypothetical protein